MRIKYCAACSIAKRNGIEPTSHWCFLNWSKSSTSMEADIIASGFKVSEQMHGLCYTELIGDGDKSVLCTSQTKVLSNGRHVTKVECANHCVKYYKSNCNSLLRTSLLLGWVDKISDTKIDTRSRKCNTQNYANKLRQDLQSGPSHLRIHDECDSSWCSIKASNQPSNKTCNVPSNLLFYLERAGDRIVSKAW